MDKRDIALQLSCPTITVPRFSEFVFSDICGDRVLVASNGVFIEITRKWGHFIRNIGEMGVTVPFGVMKERTVLLAPRLPRDLLKAFNMLARENSAIEIGASIVWNEQSNAYRLLQSEALVANRNFLSYKLPTLFDGDHLVIDCHSHSLDRAFFSGIDDEDDRHMVKFSYVVGNCHQEIQTIKMRFCLKGIFENIDMPTFWQI